MNEPQIPLFEPDEDTVARDDELLDALGSGVRLPGEDTLAMALFMWREDLDAPPKAVAAERAKRKKRRVTWSIAIGLAAVFGAGAAATAAYYAEPGNPLFPVTERVFTEQASTASAETAKTRIADAQKAVDEKKLPEAKKLLDQAETLIGKVTKLADKLALVAELQRVRDLLNAALLGTSVPTPTPAPAPEPTLTPSPGGGAVPSAAPTPSPEKSGGGLLPLPLPTISLPPLLPPLPLG